MKIYLSGPVTNEPNYRRNFKVAQSILESLGYKNIVNPAELCQVVNTECTNYDQMINICLELLNDCDAVLFLPGWKDSHGCGREWGVAWERGLIMAEYEDFINLEKGVNSDD